MKCATCQAENPDTAKFCNNCGAPLVTISYAQQAQVPVDKPKKRPRWLLIVGAIVALCVIGACFIALLASLGDDVASTATTVADPTESAQPIEPSNPIDTASPTRTSSPTSTPTPADTPTPRPTRTPVPTEEPAPDFEAYRNAIVAQLLDMADGLGRIGELLQSPELDDQDWVVDVAMAIVTVRSAYEELEGMDVEPEFADFHDLVLNASVDCYTAMDYLVSGLDNLDVDDLERAGALMESCTTKLSEATDIINEQH